MSASFRKLVDFVATASALGVTPGDKAEILWRETKNLRVALHLARYHPDTIYRLRTRYGTVHLRDNFGDVTNLPDLFYRNVYGCGILAGDGVILDVGANVGLFAARAASVNAGKKIFCFEPLPHNAKLIPFNCPGATVCCACVGARPGKVKLRVDAQDIMASSIPTRWKTGEREFEVVTLDGYARENGIGEVAFLKLDTEGMELEVLEGGRQTLQRTREIAMETHGEEKHHAALSRLHESGFTIESEKFNGRTGLVRAVRR